MCCISKYFLTGKRDGRRRAKIIYVLNTYRRLLLPYSYLSVVKYLRVAYIFSYNYLGNLEIIKRDY